MVLGVIGMVVVMSMADEVRSQSMRRAVESPAASLSVVTAAPVSTTRSRRPTPASHPAISVAMRPFNVTGYPASAFTDWATDSEQAEPSR